MISKINCLSWNKCILFVVVALIICCTYLAMGKNLFLKLDEQDYTLIESHVSYEFSTNNPEKISYIINFLNANKFYKTFKRVDTLASPEIIMTLVKKDGTTENIEIYGGAWKDGLYLLYNDTQYKIKNLDKFYENIDTLSRK